MEQDSMSKEHEKTSRLIVVEDNDSDAMLFTRFMSKNDRCPEIIRLRDGSEAIEFLLQFFAGRSFDGQQNQIQNVVVLDLSLPKLSGVEILERLKTEGALNMFYVVILSGSENPDDRSKCLQLGARSFCSKPLNIKGYKVLFDGPLKNELEGVYLH